MSQKYSQHIATVVSCNVVPFRVFNTCNGSGNLHDFVPSFEELPSHPDQPIFFQKKDTRCLTKIPISRFIPHARPILDCNVMHAQLIGRV
jgi:hypothetical protein